MKAAPSNSFRQLLQRLSRGLLDLVYPPLCTLCHVGLADEMTHSFCPGCLSQLQALQGSPCPRCAAVIAIPTPANEDCPYCRSERYRFAKVVSCGSYQGVLRNIVLQLKESRGEPLAGKVAQFLFQQRRDVLLAMQCDVVVPVPLHWTRRLWRGYNQAGAMAGVLARNLGKPCRPSWLWRVRQTPKQASVSPLARRRNLRKAFRAHLPQRQKNCRVLLVDDVLTTGSTADACTRALLAAGAGAVCVAVLARAVGETATNDRRGAI
jgi:ComF family protein